MASPRWYRHSYGIWTYQQGNQTLAEIERGSGGKSWTVRLAYYGAVYLDRYYTVTRTLREAKRIAEANVPRDDHATDHRD